MLPIYFYLYAYKYLPTLYYAFKINTDNDIANT